MTDGDLPMGDPAHWPAELLPMLCRAITCEHATVSRAGIPITLPLTPYMGEDSRTLDVSTGLTYPAKAERVRRNPRVCMLFSDPVGSGLPDPPIILVYGLGAVRDRDLQSNADRYLRLSMCKLPGLYHQLPWFVLRRERWYWTRIWIHTTPTRILWWPGGHTDEEPRRWDAPSSVSGGVSDPSPPGASPTAWKPGAADWRSRARYATRRLGLPVLTVMDGEGFPVPVRTQQVEQTPGGFRLALPGYLPAPVQGAACLTFHDHDERFAREENATFLGQVAMDGSRMASFDVDRVLGDLSAPGSWPRRVWSVVGARSRLRSRLDVELRRRGQPAPVIRRAPLAQP